jgi:uncharacterized protein YkwD
VVTKPKGAVTRNRLCAAALLACLVAGCVTKPVAPAQVPLQVQLNEVKEQLFVLVEAERERLNGAAKKLMIDAELTHAAQTHADDMAMKHSFDVDNPEGNVAVNTLLLNPKFRGYVAENSAAQYFTPGEPIDVQRFAQGFLSIWANSADHRMNIEFPLFERTGIGITVSGNMVYAAELFATDLGLPEPQ